jgi:uncharacterized protein (TIGR00369 family)
VSGAGPEHTQQAAHHPWGVEALAQPHIWTTLGFRNVAWEPGRAVVEWDAPEEYCFRFGEGHIVHGGMVGTLLDTAMGGACWTLLGDGERFLTADLRVEFFRSARPGLLRAEGRVAHRSRRVVFCSAELFDADGGALAGARCTQILLPAPAR